MSLPNNLAKIQNMIGMVKGAQNPQAMLAQMMQNNPAMAQAQQIIRENGNDPRKAFYALAKQQGIDPEEILRMLR